MSFPAAQVSSKFQLTAVQQNGGRFTSISEIQHIYKVRCAMIRLCVFTSIHLPVCLFQMYDCPYVRLSYCQSLRPSIRPSILPSIGPYAHLSNCLFLPYVRPYVYLSVKSSICPSVNPTIFIPQRILYFNVS